MTHLNLRTACAAILLASASAPTLAQDHDGHGEHGEMPQMTMAECRAMHERWMGDADPSDDEAMTGMGTMDEDTRTRMRACHSMMQAGGSMQDHMDQHMDGHHGSGHAGSDHHGDDDTPQSGDHGHHG
ncbi:MAG: hypothetical protein CMF76_07465 [Maricaulis sp.]|nr:hypothetical protein [Maricaulis sp.]